MKPLPKDTTAEMYFSACQKDGIIYDEKSFYAGMLVIVEYFLKQEIDNYKAKRLKS